MTRPRLLIADADRSFAADLADVARSLDFEVEWVGDGSALRSAIEQSDWDVLAFEVFLEEADGLEMIETLAQRHWSGPFLIFTARDGVYLRAAQSLATLRNLSGLRTFQKPIPAGEIRTLLRDAAAALSCEPRPVIELLPAGSRASRRKSTGGVRHSSNGAKSLQGRRRSSAR